MLSALLFPRTIELYTAPASNTPLKWGLDASLCELLSRLRKKGSTTMETRIDIPKNWQDFERLCHMLWRDIWADVNAQLNGRLGQAQCGVDIWGHPLYQPKYAGVQSKDKDFRFTRKLSVEEVDDACSRAVDFKPELGEFTVATTAPRDVEIQTHVRLLNDTSRFPFDVNVWHWDDIEEEVRFRPAILERFYPDSELSPQDASRVTFSLFSSKQHTYAYFSRPIMQDRIALGFRDFLLPLVGELTDNAFRHGKATSFTIVCEESSIHFEDDGVAFDPVSNLKGHQVSATGHIGSYVFKTFSQQFEDIVTSRYERIEIKGKAWNRLSFDFSTPLASIAGVEYGEFPIDLMAVQTRADGERLASSIPIPRNREEFNLLIREFRTISALSEFLLSMLKRLHSNMRLVVYLPPSPYLKDLEQWFNDKRLSIRFR